MSLFSVRSAASVVVLCGLAAAGSAQQTPQPLPQGIKAAPATSPVGPVAIKPASPAVTTLATPIAVTTTRWEPVITALRQGRYGPILPPLSGFVDLHTHPMSYLGFGGKLLYGAPDVGSPLPPGCNPPVAGSENDALGREWISYAPPTWVNSSGVHTNACGDVLRQGIVKAFATMQTPPAADYSIDSEYFSGRQSTPQNAAPDFLTWPAWDDILRQKMWVDWIRRAYAGGQRVIVALAVNNKLLGDITAGPGDLPDDDATTTDNQIMQLRAFVARHLDFMQLATSSAELYNAVSHNKLAIVLGVEIDHIGNLTGNVPVQAINAAVDHLYDLGVRYIFPIHLVDNPIGGTALYTDLFNVANTYEDKTQWAMTCEAGIAYQYNPPTQWLAAGAFVKLGTGTPGIPPATPCLQNSTAVPIGNVNLLGLTTAGAQAVQHMMDRGMLIDVDHASERAVDAMLALAERQAPVQYPLMSGHNVVRGGWTTPPMRDLLKERYLTATQYRRLASLHGMAGIGGSRSRSDQWLNAYQATLTAMGLAAPSTLGAGAFGTDADGAEFMMPPSPRPGVSIDPRQAKPPIPPLPIFMDGNKIFDYNSQGVANYGLLPQFLQDVATLPGGQAVVERMFNGAQYFFDTWFIAERDKKL